MKVTRSITDVHAEVRAWRRRKLRVAFVPTRGAIHAGHESLVRRARNQADRVVASIFVNTLQFGANEDYRSYPRTPAEDKRRLERAGAALLWVPTRQSANWLPSPLFLLMVTQARLLHRETRRQPRHCD